MARIHRQSVAARSAICHDPTTLGACKNRLLAVLLVTGALGRWLVMVAGCGQLQGHETGHGP